MTTPKLAIDSPEGRMYRIPGTKTFVPSVSTILREKRSPALANWDKRQEREDMCDTWLKYPDLLELGRSDPSGAKRQAIDRFWDDRRRRRAENRLLTSAELGTAAHSCVEQSDPVGFVQRAVENVVEGLDRPISDEGISAAVQDVELKVIQIVQCIERERLELLAQEVTVFNTKENYSGTLDIIAWHPAKGEFDEGVCVVDLKTGDKIDAYDDNVCQIAAYANCDLAASGDDEVVGFPLWDGFQVGVGAVLKATPFQSRLSFFRLDEAWRVFQSLTCIRAWHSDWQSLV